MIRSLDIPRGRLAVPWPWQRESQVRVFDAGAEADSDVVQNEDQEAEVECLGHALRPAADPGSGRREASTGGGAIRTKPLAARQ
ncbi:TPA: hypothetical protein ONA18_004786 [Pseudomonas aeruginosa]|nr:hypothetical protein [Pseudomonas aeruginosa]HBO3684782.1 hypothetical protein [Pseudomonas aeruginosa]HBO3973261.1 hypothetical protein [Pseudomonas aeruginosa]HCR1219067.1 hypothetical protein [Pseudomonas aeruginosa]HEJ1203775.1 hypothetical protein [Pseudomonas aeruginosa]